VDPLLAIADELERRDARAAEALLALERVRRDVDGLRLRAAEAAEFLDAFPESFAKLDGEEHAAAAARGKALLALQDAEADVERARKEDERLAAARALQQTRDGVAAADLWLEQAEEARAGLEREHEAVLAECVQLERRAADLSPSVRDVEPPRPGLDGALDWASRARGELLLELAALETERDKVVREASELVASVLGEPLTATGVAGVRARIERALGSPSV
jgi:chromosome segregation ATPase